MKIKSSPAQVFATEQLSELLHPYLDGESVQPALYEQLSKYLALILKWNARTNLTSVREPSEIVRRHFGESLFCARQLGEFETLLDFGSGAGFPGLPIQLYHPLATVMLAESQNKKVSFLREVVRTLSLPTEVWAGRVEEMPVQRGFDVVTMRAVDNLETAVPAAAARSRSRLIILSTAASDLEIPDKFELEAEIAMPRSTNRTILMLRRVKEMGFI